MGGSGDRSAYFVTCAPGLEPLLHGELRAMRLSRVERQVGGVAFSGTRGDAWRVNLAARTAIRVLERVARFRAPDADALYRGAADVAWEDLIGPRDSLRVDAQARDSALTHARFVEQRVKDAVADRFQRRAGRRPDVDKERPTLRIHAHLFGDRATLSVDTSGDSLHRRGWRRHQGRAPLAETTAAALVLLSGWDGRAPLLDPFCGSGTILVEAAWLAMGRAPGLARRFGCEGWRDHDARGIARLREELRALERPVPRLRLLGRDLDPERVTEANANAEAAGVAELVSCEEGDAAAVALRPGWNACVLTNPPYGMRVGEEEELVPLYRAFGECLRRDAAGYRLGVLTGNPRLRRQLGFRGAPLTQLTNGGLACTFLLVESIRASGNGADASAPPLTESHE